MNSKLKQHTYTSGWEKITHTISGLVIWEAGGTLVWILISNMTQTMMELTFFLLFIGLFTYLYKTAYWASVGLILHVLLNLLWVLGGMRLDLSLTLPIPTYYFTKLCCQ